MLKKIKNNFFLFFLKFILITSFFWPLVSSADYFVDPQSSINFVPQITLPGSFFKAGEGIKVGEFKPSSGKLESDLLANYLIAIFNYALAAVGILATVMLMGGGVVWLTSRGDSGQVSKAKNMIGGSITGFLILIFSWIILNTINPDLVQLRSIDVTVVKPITTCCLPNGRLLISEAECKTKSGTICDQSKGETCLSVNLNNFKCTNPENLICCMYKKIREPVADYIAYQTVTSKECPSTIKVPDSKNEEITLSLYYHEKNTVCENTGALLRDIEQEFILYNYSGCKEKEEGDKSSISGLPCYCYSGNCHTANNGKVGSPCGKEPFAKCTIDTKENGKNCKKVSGGRNCTIGFTNNWCCAYDVYGNRINQE